MASSYISLLQHRTSARPANLRYVGANIRCTYIYRQTENHACLYPFGVGSTSFLFCSLHYAQICELYLVKYAREPHTDINPHRLFCPTCLCLHAHRRTHIMHAYMHARISRCQPSPSYYIEFAIRTSQAHAQVFAPFLESKGINRRRASTDAETKYSTPCLHACMHM